LIGIIGIETGIKQSFIAGNNVISFDSGVTADRRLAAITCALLAQLVADKLYPDRTAPDYMANWIATYYNVLLNIGWVKQTSSSGSQNFEGSSATVEAAIFSFASALVGANGAALIKLVLDGLAKVGSADGPLTLFKQQSQGAKFADFTAGLTSNDPNAGFMLDLIEFDVAANEVDSEVIFFRSATSNAIVSYRRMKLSLVDAVYDAVASEIAQKVNAFVKDFVRRLPSP
jgi:hypothetical protein